VKLSGKRTGKWTGFWIYAGGCILFHIADRRDDRRSFLNFCRDAPFFIHRVCGSAEGDLCELKVALEGAEENGS
jgi:hypothetical protein